MASSSRTGPDSRGGKSASGAKSPESFQSLNDRNNAAEILQSYEKLSWFSMQRCEVSNCLTSNSHRALTVRRA